MAKDTDGRTRDDLLRENAEIRQQLDDFTFHLPDALVESDVVTKSAFYMNRMAQLLFGYSAEEAAGGVSAEALFAPEEMERVGSVLAAYVQKSLATDAPYERSGRQDLYEFRMRRKDGSVFVAETQSSFVLDEHGRPARMRSIVRDVTERRELERRLAELSHRDPLTGCYNRRHLEERREELERPTARWASWCSTSTVSRRSTTPTGTTKATGCCVGSPISWPGTTAPTTS